MIKLHGRIDALLLIMVLVLVIFGIVMVFSASYYSTISSEVGPYYYLQRSIRWAVIGFGVMIGVSFVPYRWFYKFAPFILVLSLVLLGLLFTPLGININGSTRWIGIQAFDDLTIMPGEIAKFAVIVFCAWYYTKYANQVKTFTKGFGVVMVVAIIYFVAIYKQPNLSTAIIVVLTILAMMFISGVPVGYVIAAGIIGGLSGYYMVQSSGGMHMGRITGFLDPFSDAQGDFFQVVQSLLALGQGGLTGSGLGNSVQKALWLPFAQNDFIFAIIGEETGFIGCLLVMVAFMVLIWRCLLIAMRSDNRFGMLLGSGIAVLFALQVAINIGVVTAVLPPTGVILPFISYGGNAILLFMFLMGIMLNISRSANPEFSRGRQKQEPRIREVAA